MGARIKTSRNQIVHLLCVQFRVSYDAAVSLGTYKDARVAMTAVEAVATVMNHTAPRGLEIIFKRKRLIEFTWRLDWWVGDIIPRRRAESHFATDVLAIAGKYGRGA